MKFMPTAGREDQSSWYGKKGITWHVSVVYKKSETANVSTEGHTFMSVNSLGKIAWLLLQFCKM